MHFGENQLSRSLIGLSPLPTTHPPGFQPWWVRTSTTSYSRFTLAMGRSPRFGSTPRNYAPTENCKRYALFGLAFATAPPPGLTSPRSMTRRLILQKARHHHHHTPPIPKDKQHTAATALTACRHTVSGTLSLPSRGTFHHSLTVLSAIGHQGVFRLTGWSRQIHSRFHEPAATRDNHPDSSMCFRVRDSHPLRRPFPEAFR